MAVPSVQATPTQLSAHPAKAPARPATASGPKLVLPDVCSHQALLPCVETLAESRNIDVWVPIAAAYAKRGDNENAWRIAERHEDFAGRAVVLSLIADDAIARGIPLGPVVSSLEGVVNGETAQPFTWERGNHIRELLSVFAALGEPDKLDTLPRGRWSEADWRKVGSSVSADDRLGHLLKAAQTFHRRRRGQELARVMARAEALLREQNPLRAADLISVARSYSELGLPQKARALCRGVKDDEVCSVVLRDAALGYLEQQNPSGASSALQALLVAESKAGFPRQYLVADAATLSARLGRGHKALELAEKLTAVQDKAKVFAVVMCAQGARSKKEAADAQVQLERLFDAHPASTPTDQSILAELIADVAWICDDAGERTLAVSYASRAWELVSTEDPTRAASALAEVFARSGDPRTVGLVGQTTSDLVDSTRTEVVRALVHEGHLNLATDVIAGSDEPKSALSLVCVLDAELANKSTPVSPALLARLRPVLERVNQYRR